MCHLVGCCCSQPQLVRMDVHVAAAGASRDDPQHLVRLGVLADEVLGDVHAQFPELREVGDRLLLDLTLGLGEGEEDRERLYIIIYTRDV